jgi:hypothetical protein
MPYRPKYPAALMHPDRFSTTMSVLKTSLLKSYCINSDFNNQNTGIIRQLEKPLDSDPVLAKSEKSGIKINIRR